MTADRDPLEELAWELICELLDDAMMTRDRALALTLDVFHRAAAVERAALPPQLERLAVRFKQPHEAAGAIVGPQTEAQERLEATTGQLLIELAFLLPEGTNVMEHPIAKKLVAFRDAVRWAVIPPAPAPPEVAEALRLLIIDANRLCDRQLGGSYEQDCRRTLGIAREALRVAEASALARPRAEDR